MEGGAEFDVLEEQSTVSQDHAQDEALLAQSDGGRAWQAPVGSDLGGQQRSRRIYISHALSTWNSRLFEFGSVLFLATTFPQTLLPASLYALVRAGSAIIFASAVGHFIDHSNRLVVLRISIAGQRSATALSCVLLYLLYSLHHDLHYVIPWLLLSCLCLLACVEKLSATMNTIAVERDWIVVVAGGRQDILQEMNSQMRRIDLLCKVLAPLLVALLDTLSTPIAMASVFMIAAISLPAEYLLVATVYERTPELQRMRPQSSFDLGSSNTPATPDRRSGFRAGAKQVCGDVAYFARHSAFLPSFSLSLLFLTVLSFGGQMINYLVSLGYTSALIGALRTASAFSELAATWTAPLLMDRIGPVRTGIWFLNYQIVCVCVAATALWFNMGHPVWSGIFLSAVIASRVGLWSFDLSAQILIQEDVESHERGKFSAIEASCQNLFELISFASTIVFARPSQFKYPATISACATAIAGCTYALFVRRKRGHLVHASKCMSRKSRTAHLQGHEYHAMR